MPASRVLRLALLAYPPADRRGYGDELLEAAVELSADGSTRYREASGLVRGGIEARFARLRLGVGAIHAIAGLRCLTLPLASLATMIWAVVAAARIMGSTTHWEDPGPTIGAISLLAVISLLVLGVARQQRGTATTAALLLFLQVFASALWHTARGGVVTASPAIHFNVGSWWFGPNITWTLLPSLLLLVAACWWMRPAAPRVPGIPRPLVERGEVRLLALVLPAMGLGAIVHLAPQLLLVEGGLETTQLPGLLWLMVVVSVVWVATTVPREQEAWAVAAALAGLCATPSVAYGAARIAISPLGEVVESRDLYVALGLLVSVVLVVLSIAFFVVLLAHVGLRAIDRRGGSPLVVGHAIPLGPDGQPSTELASAPNPLL